MQPETVQEVETPESPETHGTPRSPFMSVEDAALFFHVSPEHVYRACRYGMVPSIQLGRTVRILRAFVDALLVEVQANRQVNVAEFARTWTSRTEAAS